MRRRLRSGDTPDAPGERFANPRRLGIAQLAVAVALALVACGPPPAPVPASGPPSDQAGAVTAFAGVETEVLRDLVAVDRRMAVRVKLDPREEDLRRVTMPAVLAEDATLAVIDGAIDPFSFEARARALAAARAKVESSPLALPKAAVGPSAAPALERELLGRMVDGELVRLDEERALPRSASALVRAIVETWRAPITVQLAAERDRWLARRLEELVAAVSATGERSKMASAPLDVGRARELDDTLDSLERLIEASGLALATARLVQLREALESQGARPAAGATSDWNSVSRGLRAHLSLALAPEALEAKLAASEQALRQAALGALKKASVSADEAETKAAPLVFGKQPCETVVAGSRLRSMLPPPERGPACRMRAVQTAATDDGARAMALVVMHDHVTVARWALDVARGASTIAQTTGKHRPLSAPGPDVTARWERLALAQPAVAIGGGYAAAVLYGAGDPEGRAKVWSELGEVPLDIAERELR